MLSKKSFKELALNYSALELAIARRRLNISFQEAAKFIGQCTEEEWSAYELGLEVPPKETIDKIHCLHTEFLRLLEAMKHEPTSTLPAFTKLVFFKDFFGSDCSTLSWRVYTAVAHQLFLTDNFKVSIEVNSLPINSPLMSLDLNL